MARSPDLRIKSEGVFWQRRRILLESTATLGAYSFIGWMDGWMDRWLDSWKVYHGRTSIPSTITDEIRYGSISA